MPDIHIYCREHFGVVLLRSLKSNDGRHGEFEARLFCWKYLSLFSILRGGNMSKLFIRRLMIDFREKLELKRVEFDEKTMFLFSSEMRRWWCCSWTGVCQYNPRFLLTKLILSLTCGGVVQSVCTSGAPPSWRDLDGKCFEFFNRVKFFFRLDRCPPTRVLPPELMSRRGGGRVGFAARFLMNSGKQSLSL